MIISEFSSIVFDRENYKYDTEMEYNQCFCQEDKILVCVGAENGEDISRITVTIKNNDTNLSFLSSKDIIDNFAVFSINRFGIEVGSYDIFIENEDNLETFSSSFYVLDKYNAENTIELRYSNNRNIADTIFLDKNGINYYYSFRFIGSLSDRDTNFGMSAEIMSDINMNPNILSGFKKDKYTLVCGDNWGVPTGFGRKFRNALICYYCYMDGYKISITDEQEIGRQEISGTYPFFRFTATINYNKNLIKSNKINNFRYICNNLKTNILSSNSNKILVTNRKF